MQTVRRKKIFYRNNSGFSLIELLVALVVAGVIIMGVYSAFKTQQDSYRAQEQVAEMQQNIRAGFYIMARELRMAGYDVDQNGNRVSSVGITAASATSITFTLVADNDGIDNDNDASVTPATPTTGTDEVGELKTITYDIYDAYTDGVNDLGRRVGGVKAAVSENIEHLEFYYTLENGTQTVAPTIAQLSYIRSVQISVLAITRHPDRKYTNTNQYCPASNANCANPAPATIWQVNDNFRRRFQTMAVKLRNVGL